MTVSMNRHIRYMIGMNGMKIGVNETKMYWELTYSL